jgi:hypothetical protein
VLPSLNGCTGEENPEAARPTTTSPFLVLLKTVI